MSAIFTEAVLEKATAAALLGQSSPALVMNVYANPQEEAKTRAINNLNSLYNKKNESD